MTDRGLLEMAAKAAGIEGWYEPTYLTFNAQGRPWRPLEDDGDALRLAVKLRIGTAHPQGVTQVWACKIDVCDIHQDHDNDPYAATRRSIVRAAAEIGKVSTKEQKDV